VLGFEHVTSTAIAGKAVAVFGSGGAARAIIDGCARAGASKVYVIARSPERSEVAAAVAPGIAEVGDRGQMANADVVVNATPVGMAETNTAGQVPFAVDALRDSSVVVDIVYSPLTTPLLESAERRGLVTVDGLAMLAGQASAQFARWTAMTPPLAVLIAAAHGA